MDWHEMIGLIATCVGIVAIIPYIRDMVRGQTRPNIVSWFLWALSVGISAAAQIAAEPSWSAALIVATFFVDSTVLILALVAYGYAEYFWWDFVCLALSLVAIASWFVTNDPLVGLALAIVADGLAFIPTYVKSWYDPMSETPSAWFLFSLGGLLAACAATSYDFPSLAFPVYYFLANGLLGLLILARRKGQKTA